MEISARFAEEEEIKGLEEIGYKSIPSETGKIMLPGKGVSVADTVKLKLARILWSKRIVVEGLTYEG
ncbi:hypothetical protein [Dorea sp. D27]|uniref:hypothetical protein n=1 Tax=Dorea sp. D27 TaxID=658665 RepID=UPI000673955B|nr:hypothetical protein [Dorea sp. D27]KMZ53809.1 hypothetical protein HMPREF0980_02036 [Dorea sp. D27]